MENKHVLFDKSNREWNKDLNYNKMFLKIKQNFFNDLLKVNGHVFLNEVYDGLGFERTREGCWNGWRKGNTIDFGPLDSEESGEIHITFNCTRDVTKCLVPGEEKEVFQEWRRILINAYPNRLWELCIDNLTTAELEVIFGLIYKPDIGIENVVNGCEFKSRFNKERMI